jgi:hypothetical protein
MPSGVAGVAAAAEVAEVVGAAVGAAEAEGVEAAEVAAAACPGDRAASARRDTGGRLVGISLARVSAGLLYALA